VANKAPAAKLSMCWVYRLTTPKLSQAANQTLPIPAAKVPNKIANKVIQISAQVSATQAIVQKHDYACRHQRGISSEFNRSIIYISPCFIFKEHRI
jgi:hypothetical protein